MGLEQVDKMNWGVIFTKKDLKKKFEWDYTTLEKSGNRWKNTEIWNIPGKFSSM
jgi:hypothetical protein